MIPLIKYLKEKGITALCNEFHVKADYSIIYPELVCLCYHHTKSPKNEITNDCRGIIVNKDTFEIICYPFRRFFDYNENTKTDFDFNSFYFAEKVDGSLCNVWWYNGGWNVSTKSSADAGGFIKAKNMSYADYFWHIYWEHQYQYDLDKDCTHMFEFKFPSDTQFITQATTESITLIGQRNNKTLKEIGTTSERVCYDFATLKSIVNNLNPVTCEGYVLIDEHFNRLKLKSPAYDLIGLLRIERESNGIEKNKEIRHDNQKIVLLLSKYRRCYDLQLYLCRYDSMAIYYEFVCESYKKLVDDLKDELQNISDLEGKELGLYAKDSKFSKVLFPLKKVGDEFKLLDQISTSTYISLIKLYL